MGALAVYCPCVCVFFFFWFFFSSQTFLLIITKLGFARLFRFRNLLIVLNACKNVNPSLYGLPVPVWEFYCRVCLSSSIIVKTSLIDLYCFAFDDHSDDVCGAVINVRAKGDKIALWTTNTENREAVTYIGRKFKEWLGLPAKLVIGYQAHADTATKSNSITKNKFIV
uniref:Eukaryotic translation initiation factor 4E n=1 Tax=Erpetoichthys calabaricus TaxID=27687 RepID=A0A8C4SW08_ERPCA